MKIFAALLALFAFALIAAPRRPTVIFRDDFEKENLWSFSCRGVGTQQLSRAIVHQGKQSLEATTTQYGLINHRTGFKYIDSHSLLQFWCYADYERGDEFWVRLIVGATRDGETQPRWVWLRPPPPRQWQQRKLLIEEISPSPYGAAITGIHIGLRGRATNLRLVLDDVKLENDSPEGIWMPRIAPVAPPAIEAKRPLHWATKEKIRAAHAVPGRHEAASYAAIFQAPINTVLLGTTEPSIVIEWASRAKSYGKRLFLLLPAFPPLDAVPDGASYRRAQFADAIPDNAVCPRDARYWERGLGSILQSVTELATLVEVQGFLLDLRLSGKQHPTYTDVESCLCDNCFDEFLKDKNSRERSTFIPLVERRNFLMARNWLHDYAVWEEAGMMDIAHQTAKRLRKRHPDLILGTFAFEDSWLPRGLSEGFASTGVPTIVVSTDPARSRGYNFEVREMAVRVHEFGYPVLFVPGLNHQSMDEKTLADHLYRTAIGSDGFWLTLPPSNDSETVAKMARAIQAAVDRMRVTLSTQETIKKKR